MQTRKPKKYVAPVIGTVLILILLAVGIVPRIFRNQQLQASAATVRNTLPLVDVVRPTYAPTSTTLDVPGTIEPILQTSVNSRATGYADQVLVDIGDKVKAGQTLAIITAPDTDQETAQGQAQLVQSRDALSQSEANEVSSEGVLAEDQANLLHSEAALETARADLAQLEDQLAQQERQRGEEVANLNEAQANLDYDRVSNERDQTLANQGFLSKQTADQALSQYKVGVAAVASAQSAIEATDAAIQAAHAAVAAGIDNVAQAKDDVSSSAATVAAEKATVASNKDAVNEANAGVSAGMANVNRLVVLQNFERVVAPFSGVVTARNIDPGAYIASGAGAPASTSSIGSTSAGTGSTGGTASGSSTAGSSAATASGSSGSGSSTGLFTVSDLDRVRVYINLPQEDAGLLQDGTQCSITVPSAPGRVFTGVVLHSTVALDPQSRTLVAEIQMDNPGDQLRPGMFTDVKLTVPQPGGILLVPDSALVTGANGTQLTLVGSGNKLHFQDVQVGSDDGVNIEILNGITATSRIVSSPANGFQEGEKVQVAKPSGHKGRGHKGGGAPAA